MPSDSVASNDELVSVICRTIGRPDLAQALTSIASQSYPDLEVILVNAGNCDLQPFLDDQPDINCRVVGSGQPLSRSDAANLGMESAGGSLFLFLDDDDWIAANHIATLAAALREDTSVDAAYSSTQKTDKDGNSLELVFRQEYDPALLLRDNFMPVHAVLFKRKLFDQGCRFDIAFDIFEDWDFWLQLSEHTSFRFIDSVSAFYRAGGESQTTQDDISVRYLDDHILGQARAKVFDKWLKRWSGKDLNRVLGSMDQAYLIEDLQSQIKSVDEKLHSEHQTNLQHQQQITELLASIANLRHYTDILDEKFHSEHQTNLQHQQQITELLASIANLRQLLTATHNSVSWKITAPLRFIRGKLKGGPQDGLQDDTATPRSETESDHNT